MADQSLHFKLVLLGDTAVGKSCLVVRFVRDEFFPFQEPTIGGILWFGVLSDLAAFLTQTVNVDNVTIKFEIWDTAGQGTDILSLWGVERYRSLAPMYYRGAAAAIVVYDITSRVCFICLFHSKESFNGAKSWVKELQRRGDPNVVIALAGNKCDLEEDRQVPREEAEEYAVENNLLFMETSAKMALNVREIFESIGHKLPKGAPVQEKMDAFVIAAPQQNEKKKCDC